MDKPVFMPNGGNLEEVARLLGIGEDDARALFGGRPVSFMLGRVKAWTGSTKPLQTNVGNCESFADRFGADPYVVVRALVGEPLRLADVMWARAGELSKKEAECGFAFDVETYLDVAARKRGWGVYRMGIKAKRRIGEG